MEVSDNHDKCVSLNAGISTDFITASNADFTSVLYYPVTFNPGEERKTFTITIQDDTEPETLETFRVFIEDADGFIGTPNQAVITIVDNDGKIIYSPLYKWPLGAKKSKI